MPSKKYYEVNKEKYQKYSKKWYSQNKESVQTRSKIYYEKCKDDPKFKEKALQYNKKYYQRNKEKMKIQMNITNKKRTKILKKLAISRYSNGKNSCACCNENTFDLLTIDHINNDGKEHRKTLNYSIYIWLARNKFLGGFQVLCMNCNWGRRLTGICPHKNQNHLNNNQTQNNHE